MMRTERARFAGVLAGGVLCALALSSCVANGPAPSPAAAGSGSPAGTSSTATVTGSTSGAAGSRSAGAGVATSPTVGTHAGTPVRFSQLGRVHSSKLSPSTLTTWHLSAASSLPADCEPSTLSTGSSATASTSGGSTWTVTNTDAPCTIRPGAVTLSTAAGKTVARLQTATDGSRTSQVLATGAYARFQVTTAGPCVPTKNSATKRSTQQLQAVSAHGGHHLGAVTALTPACKGQAVQLLLLPFTEAVRDAGVPSGLSARVMTASVQQAGGKITAMLFVTNATNASFHTDTCPTLTTVVRAARIEAAARSALTCTNGFTVAAHASAAINLGVPVKLSKKEFVLADVGAYLSLGLGDDASRARTDA